MFSFLLAPLFILQPRKSMHEFYKQQNKIKTLPSSISWSNANEYKFSRREHNHLIVRDNYWLLELIFQQTSTNPEDYETTELCKDFPR